MLNLAREAMAAKGKKKKVQSKAAQEEAASFTNELNEPLWSIVSFEKCVAKNLTYLEAEKQLTKLEAEKIAGLCIVSDEAAAKIGKRSSN